jgi:hypothetical protein
MAERIAVDHHEVGQLAVLQSAELPLDPRASAPSAVARRRTWSFGMPAAAISASS